MWEATCPFSIITPMIVDCNGVIFLHTFPFSFKNHLIRSRPWSSTKGTNLFSDYIPFIIINRRMNTSAANYFSATRLVLPPQCNVGNRWKQIGQSSSGGGCLNSSLSCNSAARSAASLICSSHCFLCFDRCFFLHVALQYVAFLHLLQLHSTLHKVLVAL